MTQLCYTELRHCLSCLLTFHFLPKDFFGYTIMITFIHVLFEDAVIRQLMLYEVPFG
jgi:hypothetical protein